MAAATLLPKRTTIGNIKKYGQELREMEGIGLGGVSLEENSPKAAYEPKFPFK